MSPVTEGKVFRPRSVPIVGLVTAESLSLLGNQIASVAIPILVLQFSNSPLIAGIASAGNIVPIVLAAVLGGRAIDHFGAWKMSVVADLLSCASVLLLPLVFLHLSEVPPLLVFLLVFLGALFDPTGVSARQTLVPRLAMMAGKPLDRINSLRGGLENGADFLGPLIAVGLIGLAGTVNAFFINAATFLLCAAIFAATVPHARVMGATEAGPSDRAVMPGMRFIFKHPRLRPLAIVGTAGSFVILPFLGLLLPVLSVQKFGSTALLGLALAAFGLAATTGAASFSWLSRQLPRATIFYGGLFLTGLAIVLCALATEPYQVVLAAALAGLLLGAGNPLQQTVMHEETPPDIAGQVFTSLTAVQFAAGPLGLVLAGALTEFAGIERVLLLAGSVLLASAVLGGYALPLPAVEEDAARS